MLADLEPWEWAYWKASYRLQPWGDDWERSSLVAATTINTAAMMAPREGTDDAPTIPLDAFVPFREHKDPQDELLEQAIEGLEGLAEF